MKQAARHSGLSRYRNYSVYDVTRIMGVTPQTVRRWIKQGLPALTDKRPFLILGADLVEFLKSRKADKQHCALDQCYCVKCRKPRPCAGAMAEFVPITASSGNLRALCPECSTLMHKRVSVAFLPELSKLLELSIEQVESTLIE